MQKEAIPSIRIFGISELLWQLRVGCSLLRADEPEEDFLNNMRREYEQWGLEVQCCKLFPETIVTEFCQEAKQR